MPVVFPVTCVPPFRRHQDHRPVSPASLRGESARTMWLVAVMPFLVQCSLDLPAVQGSTEDAGADAHSESSVEDSASSPDVSNDVPTDGATDVEAGPCQSGQKLCEGGCVPTDDPDYGCAATACDPCALSHATSKCSGGVCSISQCDEDWLDCDGSDDNGCEVDPSTDSSNCGMCGYDCRGTSCTDGQCQLMPIAVGIPAAWDVAVDDTHVYMTAGQGDHDIMRIVKSGGVPVPLSDSPGAEGGVAIDDTYVYWANDSTDEIRRVPKVGGTEEVLGSSSEPQGMALDAANIYWADTTDNVVMSAPRDGSSASSILAADLMTPRTIAVDAQTVYVVTGSGHLYGVPIGGGALVQMGEGTGTLGEDIWDAWGVAVDANWVYWVSRPDLYRVPINGGPQDQELIVSGFTSVRFMTLDGGQLFICSDRPNGKLSMLDTSDPSSLRVITSAMGCHGVAVDDDYVYVTRWYSGTAPAEGGVFRVARPPSSP